MGLSIRMGKLGKKMNFYSQYGEDYVMFKFFKEKRNGICIDIGAMDGIRFSNSYIFSSQLNWKTICVEPHNFYFNILLSKRPEINCYKINAAVSFEEKKKSTFYSNFRGSLSTLDKNLENHFAKNYGKYFNGFKEQEIDVITINYIVEKYLKENEKNTIDFISIDVEGTEVDVLKGMDIEKYGPTVFVIEKNNADEISDYLIKFGYFHVADTGCNGYYVKKEEDKNKIKDIISGSIPELVKVIHPLGWD